MLMTMGLENMIFTTDAKGLWVIMTGGRKAGPRSETVQGLPLYAQIHIDFTHKGDIIVKARKTHRSLQSRANFVPLITSFHHLVYNIHHNDSHSFVLVETILESHYYNFAIV